MHVILMLFCSVVCCPVMALSGPAMFEVAYRPIRVLVHKHVLNWGLRGVVSLTDLFAHAYHSPARPCAAPRKPIFCRRCFFTRSSRVFSQRCSFYVLVRPCFHPNIIIFTLIPSCRLVCATTRPILLYQRTSKCTLFLSLKSDRCCKMFATHR